MRYRIKIITYNSGIREYSAQVQKKFLFFKKWFFLCVDGEETIIDLSDYTREDAIKRIDEHYLSSYKKQLIEFEYITKP